MKKLRPVKERKENQPTDVDLRGLGHDPLLTQSHPCPILLCKGCEPSEVFQDIVKRYGLRQETVSDNTSGFTTNCSEGEHKLATLTLFYVSVEIYARVSEAVELAILEIPQLHLRLREGILGTGNATRKSFLQEQIEAGCFQKGQLCLAASTAVYLQQAGLSVKTPDESQARVFLCRKDLHDAVLANEDQRQWKVG